MPGCTGRLAGVSCCSRCKASLPVVRDDVSSLEQKILPKSRAAAGETTMTSALDLHQKAATLGLLDKVSAKRLFYCRTRRCETNLTRLALELSHQPNIRLGLMPSCLAWTLGAARNGPGAYRPLGNPHQREIRCDKPNPSSLAEERYPQFQSLCPRCRS